MIWHIPNKTNRKPKHIPVLGKNYGRSASQKKNGIKCRDYKTEHLSTKIEPYKTENLSTKIKTSCL